MQWLRSGFLALSAAALLWSAPNPASATTFLWQLEGGTGTWLTGAGSLQTGAADGGGFDIVAFGGTIAGLPVSLIGGDPGTGTISPTGAFNYDNLLYPTAQGGVFDAHGVLLSVAGEEGNIWGNGTAGSYSYWRGRGPSYDYSDSAVTFTLTQVVAVIQPGTGQSAAVPEPAEAAVLAIALLGLCGLRRIMPKPRPRSPPRG